MAGDGTHATNTAFRYFCLASPTTEFFGFLDLANNIFKNRRVFSDIMHEMASGYRYHL